MVYGAVYAVLYVVVSSGERCDIDDAIPHCGRVHQVAMVMIGSSRERRERERVESGVV